MVRVPGFEIFLKGFLGWFGACSLSARGFDTATDTLELPAMWSFREQGDVVGFVTSFSICKV